MALRGISSSLILLIFVVMGALQWANASAPAIFIFGDSTVDVGTNNYINDTKAKANSPPNGIDFPHSTPTGRFSNGFNTADFIAKLMGFRRSPPPFLGLLNETFPLKHILRGLNFASGGSGILDPTGKVLAGNAIPLGQQIEQFGTIRQILGEVLGPEEIDSMLSKSLFLVSVGSNDIFEYFVLNDTSRKQECMDILQRAYNNHLRTLYTLGARRFGILSVPPIGCCPSQRVHNTTGGCFEYMNDYSRTFYSTVEAMLHNLSSELTGMNYSLGNTYAVVTNMMDNHFTFTSFKELAKACCGDAKTDCEQNAEVCSNRKEFLFWDRFHPTQAAAHLAVQILYNGTQQFVAPINFEQLTKDDSKEVGAMY